MSWLMQIAWTAMFAFMLIIAIGGNVIVIWIVLAHRRMRTVTNYFLLNLSIADLMMSVFNCIFNFVYMLNNDWQFGRPYCTFSNFIANVTVAASVFTLTGISLDRFLAINRPLKPRMSKTSAQITIAAIWLTSLILGSPCLMYSTTVTHRPSGQTACILIWPDGQPLVSTMDYIYNLVLFMVTYVTPMAAMLGCYTAMGRELWGSRSIGELTQRQIDSIKSKRKVVRMFIVIVTIFGVCWLPYHSYFLYTHYHRDVPYSKYVQHLYLMFYWLAMSNAMVNPLIYYWMNARFRQYFRTAVCEWRCLQRSEQHSDVADTPPMIRRCSHSYSRSRSGGTGDDYSNNERYKQQRLVLKQQQTQCFCATGPNMQQHHTCRRPLVQICVAGQPVSWRHPQHQPLLTNHVNHRHMTSSQV
ncbi:tachykinin-like peptides receptor 86C [Macrosteles quadrilineatus]|uniref:tachykinin-like peptides receptor 86C n=1 Tax=Macrosteles quadrilineatus TaxID=74068 RepID=UPI0023E16936|nr:tachykinin-like peptides receptor 86C [Macrosteles quadrilineatus]